MRFSLPKNPWHRGFMILALVSAVASFCYFFFYPALIARKMSLPIFYVLDWLLVAAPVVIVGELFWPRVYTVRAAQIHAALLSAFLFILFATEGHNNNHSSPGEFLAAVIRAILQLILIGELILVAIASVWARHRKPDIRSTKGVFFPVLISIIGGWAIGITVWGLLLPPQVIAKAEAAAQDKPYCLEAHGKHVSSRWGLTAFNMFSRTYEGQYVFFHGMMVLGEGESREYKNWSYRLGDFVAISEDVRKGQQLDGPRRCKPVPHFALKI